MQLKLKKLNYDDAMPLEGTKGIEKVISLEIERRNKIKDLFYKNFNNISYSKAVFELYDVSFDEDYSDISAFTKAKKGIITTNIPYCYDGVWTLLSYMILYYELDLEHIYTIEEVNSLVKSSKIILLEKKPYISVPYKDEYKELSEKAEREFTTIEDYNFEDISKNSMYNNYLVTKMIMSVFNYSEVNKSFDEVSASLISMLKEYRKLCLDLKTQNYGISNSDNEDYDKIVGICDECLKLVTKSK